MAQGEDNAPTMIIPAGTEIEVDAHGQLSIRAPGNLVIQNSGSYGNIESVSGSIRIDRGVEVEAVSVRCAADCFVQGSLTAWKVSAESLQLEDTARANVVLQETRRLQIGRDARLVGNFSSEKDLFLLFSRFARQVRSLPFYLDRRQNEADGLAATEVETPPAPPPRALGSGAAGSRDRLPEPLFFAHVLLDRDAARKSYGSTSQRVLEEMIKLLDERDLETLRLTYRTLFSRIIEPGEDARRARELVAGYYENEVTEAGNGAG